MKVVQVTVTKYQSIEGIDYDTPEQAIQAELRIVLGPHTYHNMSSDDMIEIIWNNRDLVVQTLTQLQEQLQNVDG